MKVLVIVPAFNEADTVGDVIEEIRAVVPGSEIVVIDDGSSDDTARQAAQSGAPVLSHRFNLGYGAALQTGYKYALQKGYDVLVQLDADGQHDPSCIPRLVEAIRDNPSDVAIGSRFIGVGNYDMPFARRCGSIIFREITSFLIKQRITDPTSGFWAIGRNAFAFCTRDIYPSDFPDADVLIMLKKAGFRVIEVPVKMRPSLSKRTMHSGLNAVYYIFKMFLSIFVTLFRELI